LLLLMAAVAPTAWAASGEEIPEPGIAFLYDALRDSQQRLVGHVAPQRQDETGTVKVTVKYEASDGRTYPLPGVEIKLADVETDQIVFTCTNSKGQAVFTATADSDLFVWAGPRVFHDRCSNPDFLHPETGEEMPIIGYPEWYGDWAGYGTMEPIQVGEGGFRRVTLIAVAADPGTNLCLGDFVTITGTDGDDVITGTAGADVIDAGAGNDIVTGRGGNDRICGGPGNDVLKGEQGINLLDGEDGNDRLVAGRGGYLIGGSGKDKLIGGSLRDGLLGEEGNDLLKGRGGDDLIWGGPGEDRLIGGAGNDQLYGGEGRDKCDTGEEVESSCEVAIG